MTIVVIGATGMLGHVVGLWFRERRTSEVVLVARRLTGFPVLDDRMRLVDLADLSCLSNVLELHRPCVVVNCAAAMNLDDPAEVDAINARLPHEITRILDRQLDGSRLIQISTDGVFSGKRGNYIETDLPDADDSYGVSKRAGEVMREPHLTIRTSIVGPNLGPPRGILDWAMGQKGEVRGFSRAIWSGVSTVELAQFIGHAVTHNIKGICHLGSEPVSKYDLLQTFNTVFNQQLVIRPDTSTVINRSLRTGRTDLNYRIPSLSEMLSALKRWVADHPALYPRWQDSTDRARG